MTNKYSDKEVEFAVKLLNEDVSNKFMIPFLADKKTSKIFEDYVNSPGLFSEKDKFQLFSLIYKEIASRMEKTQFSILKGLKPQIAKDFIPHIINNPEFYEGGLNKSEITDLVLNTNSIELIEEVIENEELGLSGEQIAVLMKRMNELEELAQSEDVGIEDLEDESGASSTYQIADDQSEETKDSILDSYQDVSATADANALKFTKEELFAIEVYEGVAPGKGSLSSNDEAYMMLNVMLFPGLENEIVRVCDDDQYLDHGIAKNPEELLKISVDLYSAMYKYGKKMENPLYARRIDREASFPEIERRGEIVSNFSTTTAAYNPLFKKENMVLVEVVIEQGAACANFSEIFAEAGQKYELAKEAEILIAPFSPITIEDARMTNEDKKIKDSSGNQAKRKVKMRIKPPKKPEPLTPEEKQEKEEKMGVFLDEDLRENASKFFRKLQKLRSTSKETIMQYFTQEEIDKYIEWKSAYQTIYRYETRERALEIEKNLANELNLVETDKVAGIEATVINVTGESGLAHSQMEALEVERKEDPNLVAQLSSDSKTKGFSAISTAIKKFKDKIKGKTPFSKDTQVNENGDRQ